MKMYTSVRVFLVFPDTPECVEVNEVDYDNDVDLHPTEFGYEPPPTTFMTTLLTARWKMPYRGDPFMEAQAFIKHGTPHLESTEPDQEGNMIGSWMVRYDGYPVRRKAFREGQLIVNNHLHPGIVVIWFIGEFGGELPVDVVIRRLNEE